MPDGGSLERAIYDSIGLPGSEAYEALRRPFNARFREAGPENGPC